MDAIRAEEPVPGTLACQLWFRLFLIQGTVGRGWMAPIVLRTAEAPVAVGTARPASVGTGVVVVVVLGGRAICSGGRTPDAV